jgi:hypothetical protein
MAASDYTDIVARFSDQLAAETLANFLASIGIPCELVENSDALFFGRRDGVRVAKYDDPVSPQVVAGRLAREKHIARL